MACPWANLTFYMEVPLESEIPGLDPLPPTFQLLLGAFECYFGNIKGRPGGKEQDCIYWLDIKVISIHEMSTEMWRHSQE